MCYELLGRSRRSDGRGPVHRDARAGVDIHGEPRNSTPHLIHRACRSTLQRRAWRRDAGRDASRAAARRECAVSPCRRCTHLTFFLSPITRCNTLRGDEAPAVRPATTVPRPGSSCSSCALFRIEDVARARPREPRVACLELCPPRAAPQRRRRPLPHRTGETDYGNRAALRSKRKPVCET